MGLLQKINLLNNFNLSKEEMMEFLDLNECVNEIGNINDEHDRDNTTTPNQTGHPHTKKQNTQKRDGVITNNTVNILKDFILNE